jgi:amino acid adenylation domain-containing protein
MATVNAHFPMDPQQPSSAGHKLRDGEPLPLVAELIATKAKLTPHALALASSDETLTYGDMEAQANRLAHYLQSIGVGPEALVGICLDRGPAMVVAALAILKAGGAYLPLDPEFPVDRLRFMLDDAQTPVLITRQEIDERIAKGRWKVVDIEADQAQIAGYPTTSPTVSISPENLAYVIYTSGSTGRPKGVQITHRNLLNLISWHNRAFSISATDRASQLASLAFDAAVWEIWPYLVAGSSVHFPDDETRVSVEPLRDWLTKERITVSFVATPLAESLTSLEWPRDSALRILLTGADTLHHYPPPGLPFALVNNYGPTECTVVATSGTVAPNPHPSGPPNIGRAIDNFQIYILDEDLRQVPAGTVGQLHIGGAGLGRGYLNRPDLDAERFIANPFSSIPGDRLYKTGDLVRLLPDGNIAFVGRMDGQIKIRGYRIEPDEIAAVLDQYSGIKGSVVVARDDSGDKRLVAYVVVASDVELTHSALQDFLKNYLPDYMVPAAFVQVSSLPMTHSGKVDRAALPIPGPENTVADQVFVAPRTPTEERVVTILAELLGVGQLSVNDNFFFLGGHSLLGTQLIARTRDAFGVELPLRTVFDFPTAAEISGVIEEMLRRESMSAD